MLMNQYAIRFPLQFSVIFFDIQFVAPSPNCAPLCFYWNNFSFHFTHTHIMSRIQMTIFVGDIFCSETFTIDCFLFLHSVFTILPNNFNSSSLFFRRNIWIICCCFRLFAAIVQIQFANNKRKSRKLLNKFRFVAFILNFNTNIYRMRCKFADLVDNGKRNRDQREKKRSSLIDFWPPFIGVEP